MDKCNNCVRVVGKVLGVGQLFLFYPDVWR